MLSLLLIPAGLIVANLLSTANAGSKLIKTILGYSISKGKLITKMQFTNPTSQELYVNYVFIDLMAGTTPVGQTRQENLEKTLIIKKDGSTVFNFESTVLAQSLLTVVAQQLLKGAVPPLQLTGYIKVNDVRIPFNQPIKFIP